MVRSLLAVFLLTAASAMADSPALVLSIEERAVVISGASPGTDVAVFGIAHDWGPYDLKIVDYSGIVADDDRDGTVRFTVPKPIPRASYWVAVDLRNGRSSSGGTAHGVKRKQMPRHALRQENSGRRAGLRYPFENALVWIVRPGGAGGAWVGVARDGASSDRDQRANGFAEIDLEDLTPLGKARARIRDYKPGDLVFVVDPFELELADFDWQEQ